MQFLKKSIIGFLILIGLVIQVQSAHAIYSPMISKRVNIIKQNILAARQMNGAGTLLSAAERVAAQDTELRNQGKATSLPGEAMKAMSKVTFQTIEEVITAPLDPLYMVINIIPSTGSVVSDCLRDDIWILEDMRDAVAREMIKAYLMGDLINGGKLMDDYDYLTDNIFRLKKYGNNPSAWMNVGNVYMTSSEYFFNNPSPINSYSIQFPIEESKTQPEEKGSCVINCSARDCKKITDANAKADCEKKCENICPSSEITWKGCPQSDFLGAFEEVRASWENLKVMAAGGGSSWGSIWEMAEARAKIKADQWIKANQITLTIGGKEGGNPQSLVNGGGFAKFVGQVLTQGKIVTDMIGPLTPLFSWGIYASEPGEVNAGCMYYYPTDGVFRACTMDQLSDYKKCIDPESTKEDLKSILCDRYRQPGTQTASDVIASYQQEIADHEKRLERTETAFIYNMQLNSVGENNLQAMHQKLSAINSVITCGYEGMGNKCGPSLPSLYKEIAKFFAQHCANK
jgi:hypothetical protein